MVAKRLRLLARYITLIPALLLAGCSSQGLSRQFVLFRPAGPLANVDFRFTILDVVVMLGIIVPTAIMTTVFLLRYRKPTPKPFMTRSGRTPISSNSWSGPFPY